MPTSKGLVIPLFIVACIIRGFGQGTTEVRHFNERDGLSYRWVLDIIQDNRGFMWFGTYDGLNRYDGQEFVTFKHSDSDSNSISNSQVFHVAQDSEGTIWTYGYDLVFNRINPVTGHARHMPTFLKDGVPTDMTGRNMKHFASLTNGDFVVMVQSKDLSSCSLLKYDFAKEVLVEIVEVSTEEASIRFFSEHNDGRLWIWGMGSGYYLVDLESGKTEYFPVESAVLQTSPEVAVPIDDNGDLWFPVSDTSVHNGTKGPHLGKFRLPALDFDRIGYVRSDNLGGIWINYGEDSLFRFDVQARKLEVFTDPFFGEAMDHRAMRRFYVDEEGASWTGHFYGAARIVNQPNLFVTYLSTPKSDEVQRVDSFSIRDIAQLGPSKLLVKTTAFQLFMIDLASDRVEEYRRSPQYYSDPDMPHGILSMLISEDGYLWTAQVTRLVRSDLNTGEYVSYEAPKHISGDYARIFEDNSGNLWWCSQTGIYLFDRDVGEFIPVETGHPVEDVKGDFSYASYDPALDVIYGTWSQGIYRIDCDLRSSSLIEVFSETETDYTVMAILFWDDKYWLSTDKGLVRFDPAMGERRIYTRADGLPSDIVYSALGSGEELWLATHNGLCQFDHVNLQMKTFYTEQGLPSNEFNRWSYFKTDDGQMFFGGLNGIIGFHPSDFSLPGEKLGHLNLLDFSKYNQKEDKVISVVNNPVGPIDDILISPYERTLAFRYGLSVYEDVENNQYSHYLEGLERDWIVDGNRNEVRYIQVPPGNYTFRVRAKGPNKMSSVNELAIPFTVEQYWYLRTWAILMYVLIVAGAVISFYRFQLTRRLERQEADRIRELEEVKTRLYTNITHEFRTPLTVMLGMNEAVNEYAARGDLDKVNHSTEMIDRNARNLLDLVNQMLDLSKLESGMLDVHNELGDILSYLRYRLEAFQSYAAEKNIELNFSTDESDIMMDFDPDRVSHIVSNLVSNAIKFTPEHGRIDVSASRKTRPGEGQFLEFCVRDTGIGIPESKIGQIFERFYQAEGTLRKGEGTGIGLSLVNEIIKLLGGSISVKSKPGEGAEFTVLLPITNRAAVTSDSEGKGGKVNWDQNASRLRDDMDAAAEELPLVLIVEDNADVTHYIGISIEKEYRTEVASDGSEGIARAIELIPDVIISDVMMPGTNGYELCKAVKQDERTSHIPVILLTAKTDQVSKVEGLQHGADAYLAKPFDQRELLIRLHNLLALRAEMQKRYAKADYSIPLSASPNPEDAFIRKIRSLILEHLEEDDFDVAKLCQLAHVSRAQLHRKLTAITGQSTTHLMRDVQMEKARELLATGQLTVSEVAYQSGFSTQAHFSRVFAENMGCTPSEYRKSLTTKGH